MSVLTIPETSGYAARWAERHAGFASFAKQPNLTEVQLNNILRIAETVRHCSGSAASSAAAAAAASAIGAGSTSAIAASLSSSSSSATTVIARISQNNNAIAAQVLTGPRSGQAMQFALLSGGDIINSNSFNPGDLVCASVVEDEQQQREQQQVLRVTGLVLPASCCGLGNNSANDDASPDNSGDSNSTVEALASFAALVPGVPLVTALTLQESGAWSRLRMSPASIPTAAATPTAKSESPPSPLLILTLLDQLCSHHHHNHNHHQQQQRDVSSTAIATLLEQQASAVSTFIQRHLDSSSSANAALTTHIRDTVTLCRHLFADPLTDSVAERSGCTVTWWRHKLLFASSPLFVTHVVAAFLVGDSNTDNKNDDDTAFYTSTLLELVSNVGKHVERVVTIFAQGGGAADSTLLCQHLDLCVEATEALAVISVALRAWRDSAMGETFANAAQQQKQQLLQQQQQDTSTVTTAANKNDPVIEVPDHIEGTGGANERRWIRESAADLYLLTTRLRAQACVVDAIVRGTNHLVRVVGQTVAAIRLPGASLVLLQQQQQQKATSSSSSSCVLPTIADADLGTRPASQLLARCKSALLERIHISSLQESDEALRISNTRPDDIASVLIGGTNSHNSGKQEAHRISQIFGRMAAAHLLEQASSLIYERGLLATDVAHRRLKAGRVAETFPRVARQRFGLLFEPSAAGQWVEAGLESAVNCRISPHMFVLGDAGRELDSRLLLHGQAPKWLLVKQKSDETRTATATPTLGLLTVCAAGQNIWLVWFTVAAVISSSARNEEDEEQNDEDQAEQLAPATLAVNLLHHDAALVRALLGAAEMSREELSSSNSDNAGACCVFFRSDAIADQSVEWSSAVASQISMNLQTALASCSSSASAASFIAPVPREAEQFVLANRSSNNRVRQQSGTEQQQADQQLEADPSSPLRRRREQLLEGAFEAALHSLEEDSSFALTPNQLEFVEAIGKAPLLSQQHASSTAATSSSSLLSVVVGHGTARTGRSTTLAQAAVSLAAVTTRIQEEAQQQEEQQQPPTPAQLREAMLSKAATTAKSSDISQRIAARRDFLLRLSLLQHDSAETAPTLFVTRAGDTSRVRSDLARLENSLNKRSGIDSKINSGSASATSVTEFLQQATARCARAPLVQKLVEQLRAATRQLAALSHTLATSRGILSSERLRAVLSPSQFRHLEGNTAAPVLLQELQRIRDETEEPTEDGDDEGDSPPFGFDTLLATWIASAAAASSSSSSFADGFPIVVLPLPAMNNSSAAAEAASNSNSASSANSDKKLVTGIALLARTDFNAKAAHPISQQTAEACVVALRYRCLTAVLRERSAVFLRIRSLAATIRDFVESTAVQAIRSSSASGGRIVVASQFDVIAYSSLLSRVPFRCVLADDADAVLASPMVSCAAPVLRPMQLSWLAATLDKIHEEQSATPTSAAAAATARRNARTAAKAAVSSRLVPCIFGLVLDSHNAVEEVRVNGAFNRQQQQQQQQSSRTAVAAATNEPIVVFPVSLFQRLVLASVMTVAVSQRHTNNNIMQQQQHSAAIKTNTSNTALVAAHHVLLADEGIAEANAHTSMCALRRALLSETSSGTAAGGHLTTAIAAATHQHQPHQQMPGSNRQPISTNSSSTLIFARSVVRPVSLWAVPVGQQQEQLDQAAARQLQQQQTGSGAVESIVSQLSGSRFVAAVGCALAELSLLAAASSESSSGSSSSSFVAAFVSEHGNLLSFEAERPDDDDDDDDGAAQDDDNVNSSRKQIKQLNEARHKFTICTSLSSIPSTVEALVLVIVPQRFLPLSSSSSASNQTAGSATSNTTVSRFSCLRSVSDSTAAARLLLRAAGAVVCISTSNLLSSQQLAVNSIKQQEQILAELAEQQRHNPLQRAQLAASAANANATLQNLLQGTAPWVRALLRTAFECRAASSTVPDADLLFDGATSCAGRALEICCPRHQLQARGFLLFSRSVNEGDAASSAATAPDSATNAVVRLLPTTTQQQAQEQEDDDENDNASKRKEKKANAANQQHSGLFGTCAMTCIAKYDGCPVRSHMCLEQCHARGEGCISTSSSSSSCDGGGFSTTHQQPCPFPCSRKLQCGHPCGHPCGAPCGCTIDEPVVIVERECGEMCIVGVDSNKNPTTEFFKHRAIRPCGQAAADALLQGLDPASVLLPPCEEVVEVACGRCGGPIHCVCSEQPLWLVSDQQLHQQTGEQQQQEIDPSSFYFLCQSCRDNNPTGETLEKLQVRSKMLAKRTGLLAARDGPNSTERVAAITKRYAELQQQSEAVLQRVAAEGKAAVMAAVERAKKALAQRDQVLADLAAHRVQFFSAIKE